MVLLAKNKDNDFFSINFLKNNIGYDFQLIVVLVSSTHHANKIIVLTLNLFKTTLNSSCKNLYFSVYLFSAAYVDKCDQALKV